MLIKFANGATLTPITTTGAKRTVQGATRDVLSFAFPADASMDELNKLFTPENCEIITIVETRKIPETGAIYENEHQYVGYVIRDGIKRENLLVRPETAESAAVYEDRITVSMAQRTYAETQLASLMETIDILVMEKLAEEVTE
jgi:hypothetical protein